MKRCKRADLSHVGRGPGRSRVASIAMTITLTLGLGIIGGLACGSSGKPSEAECRIAIDNMRSVLGTEKVAVGADRRRAVRACQGNSSKKSVQCFGSAKTKEELLACEGETGEKYFDEEKKAQDEIQRKLDEKESKTDTKTETETEKETETE